MVHYFELLEGRDFYSRPTQTTVQTILREVYGIQVYAYSNSVRRRNDSISFMDYVFRINQLGGRDFCSDARDQLHQSYEGALEAGLKRALELLQNKEADKLGSTNVCGHCKGSGYDPFSHNDGIHEPCPECIQEKPKEYRHECKVCGEPFEEPEELYNHIDENQNIGAPFD